MTATAVRPFQIAVPDEVLDDLRERLRRTRFPGEVAGSGWEYGANLGYLKELVAYWLNSYDWRAAEAALNRMPQFTATVNGLDLHFVHARGNGPAPMPLLFSHGWPGSFWEVHKILGPLTDPAAYGGDPADAFDVVAPSLPGYGFSQDPGTPGMSPSAVADLFADLMTDVLGYRHFGAQGGDWGAVITARLGYAHPNKVAGIHLNMLGARPFTGAGTPPLSEAEKEFMGSFERYRQRETGYMEIQGTKPQTLAYGLNDSPAGLAGWIVEKFRVWSDCGGDVEQRFSKDELLTNIMIYWVTGSIGSSVRLYYESRNNPWALREGEKIAVPTGFARFAVEITRPPREWVERVANVQQYSDFPRGGHFAALEEPDLLVEDIRGFFRPLRG
ncbi:MAG: epoxide hydrolase [Chloroflexi bacterium]|nr:epoxide hydrolase [Chloroflexota bacterium]